MIIIKSAAARLIAADLALRHEDADCPIKIGTRYTSACPPHCAAWHADQAIMSAEAGELADAIESLDGASGAIDGQASDAVGRILAGEEAQDGDHDALREAIEHTDGDMVKIIPEGGLGTVRLGELLDQQS